MLENRGAMLAGLGVGAGLMYFLDPAGGRRRRALVRDQAVHAAHVTSDAAGATGRDVSHRATGLTARMGSMLRRKPVDDRVLVERVRARLGRYVSHPHAIEVDARDGVVTLRGPILQAEVRRLLRVVSRVRGVREVVNSLDEHRDAGNVPALQGAGPASGPLPPGLQAQWSPTTRLLAGASGVALAGYGASRKDVPGAVLATMGLGLAARATTSLDAIRLTGFGARHRAVDVQKTITIDAPIEKVYEFWSAYENFPRFMSRVLDVHRAYENRSHWKVAGPGGMPVEFAAEVTEAVPHEIFAWRTVEGSIVEHAGIVRFDRAGDNRTRVQIRMSYNPPGGWFGHGVAKAFGVDPRRSFNEDLVRLKTLLETGRPARDAARSQVH